MSNNNDFLIKGNTALNELYFSVVASVCKSDINCIYEKLMLSGIDDVTLGFWIWDINKNIEMYSPQFRATIQYEGKHDFPDTPESWQNAIIPEDKIIALDNFTKHVESKTKTSYLQTVTYNRKISGQIKVVCHGLIVEWDKDVPLLMIGVHLPEDGLYLSKK